MAPIVCYVTDRTAFHAGDPVAALAEKIRAAVAAGADWVQIREKDLPARIQLELVRGAVEAGGRTGRILVNDRLDVALAARASGVHLGGESLEPTDVIRWCRAGHVPRDFLIGVSCHNLEEATAAAAAGASYVIFGPVFDTPSKRSFGPAQGIERLREVCQSVEIAILAIGGITEENAAACLRAGAAGIAAIRLFQDVNDDEELRQRIARIHNDGSST